MLTNSENKGERAPQPWPAEKQKAIQELCEAFFGFQNAEQLEEDLWILMHDAVGSETFIERDSLERSNLIFVNRFTTEFITGLERLVKH